MPFTEVPAAHLSEEYDSILAEKRFDNAFSMAASALPASGLNREHISDLHFVATCGRASPLARRVSRSTLAIF
jgi:hypothetical protein